MALRDGSGLRRASIAQGSKSSSEAAGAGIPDKQTRLVVPLAMILHPPIRVMADAPRLADHEIRRGEVGVELGDGVFLAAVVMQEAAAGALDQLALDGDDGLSAADAQNGAFAERGQRRLFRSHG